MAIKPVSAIALCKRPEVILPFVFIIALAMRLLFVAQWHATPYGATPILDAQAYDLWAKDVAQGHLMRGQAFYQLPLFPYALGALYWIFGTSSWIASLFNATLDALSCALLALIAFDMSGALAALMTGLLAASYAPLIFYTAPVMKESLGVFLLTLSLFYGLRAVKSGASTACFGSGAFLGLCALVRGNVIALGLILPVALYFKKKSTRLFKKCTLYACSIALAILPVTLHNFIASNEFVLISTAGGFNAYIGNGPMATGTSYVFPPGVTSNPAREEYDIAYLADKATGKNLTPSQVSDYWAGLAFDYALAHPAHEAQLLMNKIGAFWSNDEPFDNYDMSFIAKTFPTLLGWPHPCFGLIAAMAAFSVIVAGRRYHGFGAALALTALLYMTTLLPFYVTDRYRLPVVVFLLPLAGAALPLMQGAARNKSFRLIGAALIIAFTVGALSFLLGNQHNDDAYNWAMLATIYEDEGQDLSALEAFDRANMIDRRRVGADAWIKASDAAAHIGQPDKAQALLQDAVQFFPNDASVTYNYGRLAFLGGEDKVAMTAFEKAITQMPVFTPSYRGLASVYPKYGDRVKATAIIQDGLKIVPNDPELLAAMTQIEKRQHAP